MPINQASLLFATDQKLTRVFSHFTPDFLTGGYRPLGTGSAIRLGSNVYRHGASFNQRQQASSTPGCGWFW